MGLQGELHPPEPTCVPQVDARNIDGSTPLCDACASGSLECVKLLLAHGAKVNPPLYTASPLHEACMSGEWGIGAVPQGSLDEVLPFGSSPELLSAQNCGILLPCLPHSARPITLSLRKLRVCEGPHRRWCQPGST